MNEVDYERMQEEIGHGNEYAERVKRLIQAAEAALPILRESRVPCGMTALEVVVEDLETAISEARKVAN